MIICCPQIFFKIYFFKKIFQEHYQSVKQFWIKIRTNILPALIWVLTVCKGYQQTARLTADDKIRSLQIKSQWTQNSILQISLFLLAIFWSPKGCTDFFTGSPGQVLGSLSADRETHVTYIIIGLDKQKFSV